MEHLKLATLLSAEQIQERVTALGKELNDKFLGESVVAVCILKGSIVFYSDLIRAIEMDIACDYIGASSYKGGTKSTGEVKLTLDLSYSVQDKHILLVEDIVDSGITLNYLHQMLGARNPKSISTVALLSKPDALKVDVKVDHVGFEIGNEFVVGYGLDYQGYYRNLPHISQVENLN